jgi:DNA-directed RNA polymerase specialized sigma24 family protein
MPPRDSDPPSSDSTPALADTDAPASDSPRSPPRSSEPADPPSSPPAHAATPPALPHEIVEDFLSRPLTLQWITALIKRRVPPQQIEDVRQDILEEALTTTSVPRDEKALPSWLRTIATRVISDNLTKQTRRDEREVTMAEPRRAQRAPAPGGEDAGADPDELTYDPFAGIDFGQDGFLIRPWLERQVAGDARDTETLLILLEKAQSGQTYGHVAAERGMSLTALSARIFQFKKKYLPRYRRYRNRAVLLFLLGAAAVVLALAIWILWASMEKAGPDETSPARPGAFPSSSAPSAPRFEPAPQEREPRGVSHPRPADTGE